MKEERHGTCRAIYFKGCGSALSLFTGETRNGDNLQSEFDYLITVGISQSGEESSWKDANTASFMDTFVKSNGYEAVYADAGSDQEKQIVFQDQ